MKNRKSILLKIFFLFLMVVENSHAQKLKFDAEEINVSKEGDIIIGKGNAKTIINDEIEIYADEFTYDKIKKELIAINKIKVVDKTRNLELKSQILEYSELSQVITVKNEVVFFEKNKNILIKSNHIEYSVLKDTIFSRKKTTINVDDKYQIFSSDVSYNNLDLTISSDNETTFRDNQNNIINSKNFFYSHLNKIFKGEEVNLTDFLGNIYSVSQGFFNLDNREIVGKDIVAKLKNDTFDNPQNEPRLKGNSIIFDENKTIINKGVFSTCKNNDSNCPPWHITSKKIIHDKEKKEIHYKDAWLKIYNTPILYFPKFFHPDPSVKRRSGFLAPRVNNNNNLGTSINVPYFHVFSASSDLTFNPRVFSPNEYLLQNEYRKVTKNSNHIIDFSVNKSSTDQKSGRKTHFFSNSSINNLSSYFDKSSLDVKLEKVSNDNYIREYNLEGSSPIIKDTNVLESTIEFSFEKNGLQSDFSMEVYETMNKTNNDRYEFVYPSYSLSKSIFLDTKIIDSFDFKSNGNQKKFSTNIYEGVQINDVIINSNEFISKYGFTQNVKTLFKNINSEGKNSSKYKDELQSEVLNLSMYDISLPLVKKVNQTTNYLTPKISFRYSPNDTKNIKSSSTIINSGSVFSLERIGHNDNIEGGTSLTLGLNFEKKNKQNETFFESQIATIFRDKEEENLPTKSTLGKKQSDVIGEISFKPSEIFEFNYNYLLDNDIDQVNLHNISNTIKINNFVSNFTFYEENNLIGKESFYTSSLGYEIDENNLIKFSTRENKKDNLTEFYNLIYEYKNDCLTASIKYNKKYYSNSYLKPTEDLFFTLTIIPLGSTQTDSVLD